MTLAGIKALTFDVFGTVVDYRSAIIAEGQQINQAKGLDVDWGHFTDAWRGQYRPAMDKVMSGELPWTNIDGLHRMILDQLLIDFGIDVFTDEEKVHLNLVWHRLGPWPDAIEGLQRLRERFVVATLSNGNMALLTNMAKYSNIPWDCILSAELARRYKPDPQVYLMAAELLGLHPHEILMVAAHQSDLQAAQKVGFKAAFVLRPLEFGPDNFPDLTPDPAFEIVANDFIDLADQLLA